MDMTTNTTKKRSNRYAGTCDRCRVEVPAGAGFISKPYPFTKDTPWKTVCQDEVTCKARVEAWNDKVAARQAEIDHLRRLRTGYYEELAATVRDGARFDFPKTMKVRLGDWVVKIERRKQGEGVKVRVYEENLVTGEKGESSRWDCGCEDEAMGRTADYLRRPWYPENREPFLALLDNHRK